MSSDILNCWVSVSIKIIFLLIYKNMYSHNKPKKYNLFYFKHHHFTSTPTYNHI